MMLFPISKESLIFNVLSAGSLFEMDSYLYYIFSVIFYQTFLGQNTFLLCIRQFPPLLAIRDSFRWYHAQTTFILLVIMEETLRTFICY